MAITITLDRRQATALDPKKGRKAATRAMRKAGISGRRAMVAEATRRVRARKALKVRDVKRAISTSRQGSTVASMVWGVHLDGRPVPLIAYKARQTLRGVTAEVERGKRTLLKGAFITVTRSGHKGVYQRRGRARLPIDEKLGSRPVDALLHDGEAEAVAQKGAEVARAAYPRLLALEISKI